jgi:uncharacterized protein YgiM (DUF1202 family)
MADLQMMSTWTKIAAIFSILASVITIYNVAARPKDAPPIWNAFLATVGMGPKAAPDNTVCLRVRRPVWPESTWSVRSAPGNDHRELGRIAPGDVAVQIGEAGGWVQIREQAGLGATIQGWTIAKAVEKVTCPAKK